MLYVFTLIKIFIYANLRSINGRTFFKSPALQANTHAPYRAGKSGTLGANKEKPSTGFKPLSTRALEKTKHDRSGGGKKVAKPAVKQKSKSNKNKGKPKR